MEETKTNQKELNLPQFISLSEAAKISGYTAEHLNLLSRKGILQAEKIGHNWNTTKKWLDKYLASRKNRKTSKGQQIISLSEAAKISGYTAEHLNLLSRKGILKGKKVGRNWNTTEEWLTEFLAVRKNRRISRHQQKERTRIIIPAKPTLEPEVVLPKKIIATAKNQSQKKEKELAISPADYEKYLPSFSQKLFRFALIFIFFWSASAGLAYLLAHGQTKVAVQKQAATILSENPIFNPQTFVTNYQEKVGEVLSALNLPRSDLSLELNQKYFPDNSDSNNSPQSSEPKVAGAEKSITSQQKINIFPLSPDAWKYIFLIGGALLSALLIFWFFYSIHKVFLQPVGTFGWISLILFFLISSLTLNQFIRRTVTPEINNNIQFNNLATAGKPNSQKQKNVQVLGEEQTQEALITASELDTRLFDYVLKDSLQKNQTLAPIPLEFRNQDFEWKNQEINLAKDSVDSREIARHAIQAEDIDTNSITSRTIRNYTIQGEDINPDTTISVNEIIGSSVISDSGNFNTLTIDSQLTTYNLQLDNILDFGTNTIADGNFVGDWNFNGGDLATTGTLNVGATTLSGNLDMANNIIQNIGNVNTDFDSNGGLTLAGNLTVNGIGTNYFTGNIFPSADISIDLGDPTHRFNNLYSANIITAAISTSGQAVFNYQPANTNYAESSVLINPTTAIADAPLLGIGVGGVERLRIDEDGDITTQGNISGGTYNGLTITTTTGTFTLTSGKTLTVSDSATLANNTLTLGNGKILTLSDSTTLNTDAITLAGGEVITFSPVNALSLLTTGATSVTLPTSGTLISTDQTAAQTIGNTTNRLARLWATDIATTDLTVTNTITGHSSLDLPLAGGTLTGNLLFSTDNTLDIGANAATRPRTGYFGTSVIAPTINATTALQINDTTVLSGTTLGSTIVSSSLTSVGTLANLTVTNAPTLSAMTLGSVLFAGTAGLISQDNANFFWDDTNKRLGIGTTGPSSPLHIVGQARFQEVGDVTNYGAIEAANDYVYIDSYGTAANSGGFIFRVKDAATNSMTIAASGNVGIGTTNPGVALDVSGVIRSNNGIRIVGAAPAGDYTYGFMYDGSDNQGLIQTNIFYAGGSVKAATTIAEWASFRIDAPGLGSGASITNNYAIYQSGAAQKNYFAGNVGIGTAGPISKLAVGGPGVDGANVYSTGGSWGFYGVGTATGIYANGGTTGVFGSGGTYDFYAAGAGANYAPFTGSHEAILASDFPSDAKPGMIVSTTGEAKIRDEGISSTLVTVKLTDTPNDNKTLGVFTMIQDLPAEHWYKQLPGERTAVVNALGEGLIWVTNYAGEIKNGDRVISSPIPGYGMKEDGRYPQSYVVAKITEDIDWSKVTETVKYNGVTYKAHLAAGIYDTLTSTFALDGISTNNGKLGLGTTNPTEKLEIVDGNIKITNGTLIVGGVNLNDQISVQTQSLASLQLKTEGNATTIAELETDINEQLTIAGGKLDDLIVEDATINEKIADINDQLLSFTTLQSQIDEIKTQNETILGFLNITDGNFNLMDGTLEAEGVVAGAFTVKVKANGDSKTIGKYILCPALTEVDSLGACSIAQVDTTPVDGKDDTTLNPLRDGKSVIVKTKVIKSNSKVFITPKSAVDQPLAVTTIIPGESFTVEVKNPVMENMEFDWFVVGEQVVSEPL